ncbi:MAG: transposase [Acidobacteria bacterium]|nr:transposase [Acidobacteriota bacterium]
MGSSDTSVFANTQAGFSQLSEWLVKNNVNQVHACLEATGTYSQALATYLSDGGQLVSVVNPAATKAYAGAQLSRYPDRPCGCRVNRSLLSDTKATTVEARSAGNARAASTCQKTRFAH